MEVNEMADKKAPADGWPVISGDYIVGDPESPVAVTTLASHIEGELSGAAIAGPCKTENLGIEKVVANIISNPNIRFLIVTGAEVQGHITGQSIKALYENGADPDKKKITGATGAIPFVENIPLDGIERFQNQLEIIDLIDTEDTGAINAKIKEATTTIGYKRLLRFQPITTKKLRIRFEESRGPLCINGLGAYYAPNAQESYDKKEEILNGLDYTVTSQDHRTITFDLGQKRQIRSLHYKPAQTGMISHYELWAGDTPENMKLVISGEFSNIRNNPIMQDLYFAPADCRYVLLKAVRLVNESEPVSYEKIIIL